MDVPVPEMETPDPLWKFSMTSAWMLSPFPEMSRPSPAPAEVPSSVQPVFGPVMLTSPRVRAGSGERREIVGAVRLLPNTI